MLDDLWISILQRTSLNNLFGVLISILQSCQNLVLTPFPLLQSGSHTYSFYVSRLDAVVLFPTLSAILRTSPLRVTNVTPAGV